METLDALGDLYRAIKEAEDKREEIEKQDKTEDEN